MAVDGTRVAAMIITHGPHPDLEQAIRSLAPQVDELVLIDNLPGPQPELPPGARSIVNDRQVGFAANTNRGFAATSAPFVVLSNADAIAEPDAVRILMEFALAHPTCGIVGPQLRYPDGSWQSSRRRFPTPLPTLVRRTPLRYAFPNERYQRAHYLLDEQPQEPIETEWMIGGFLLIRREMFDALGGFDEAFRLYGEEIDFSYRAAKAGWERWFVPAAVVQHRLAAVIDHQFLTRRTIWHLRGMIRFVRKHPERLRPSRDRR
jgi:N-acetylglucosaminyl-diphospho-decaprenol L-rhamnosyltransferase